MSVWDGLLIYGNIVAMAAFMVLIFGPRTPPLHSAILYFGVSQIAALYAAMIFAVYSGVGDSSGVAEPVFDFFTVERVRDIFLSDGAVAFGWFHYLAIDLFVGLWISQDADKHGVRRFVQGPILGLTFLASPAGLLLWLTVRKLTGPPNS